MTQKKKYTIGTPPGVDENFNDLYRNKIEGRYANVHGTATARTFQSIQTGMVDATATGSATVTVTVALPEPLGEEVYVAANARSPLVIAAVTNVTQSQIEIQLRAPSGTANYSDVITATLRVNWMAIGSQP